MNVDRILEAFADSEVDCLLIGGMNFLLNHVPVTTFDVDLWIEDSSENKTRTNTALHLLSAEWGPTATAFAPVPKSPDWLNRQSLFCLFTPFGDLDLFREVRGLEGRYGECRAAARPKKTPTGIPYLSLSDRHMLDCQLALAEGDRKLDRMAVLQKAMETHDQPGT